MPVTNDGLGTLSESCSMRRRCAVEEIKRQSVCLLHERQGYAKRASSVRRTRMHGLLHSGARSNVRAMQLAVCLLELAIRLLYSAVSRASPRLVLSAYLAPAPHYDKRRQGGALRRRGPAAIATRFSTSRGRLRGEVSVHPVVGTRTKSSRALQTSSYSPATHLLGEQN
jgi:hypothetical protein